jgi:fumarate hydratase, class I
MSTDHHSLFQLGPDATPYRKLTSGGLRMERAVGRPPSAPERAGRTEVENFPAFIIIEDKGNDFFKELNLG